MKIGIDISQTAYRNTGVSNYLIELVGEMVKNRDHEFVLFYSSMRRNFQFPISNFQSNPNVQIKKFRIPPAALDIMWNKLHIVPIEVFIGKVDLFITSDWTEPPAKAPKATIIYDMIVYKHPLETDQKIISVQKRKLKWVKKESNIVFCISKSTKKDAEEILGIEQSKIKVIYPGL